jgi:hypothetical protein
VDSRSSLQRPGRRFGGLSAPRVAQHLRSAQGETHGAVQDPGLAPYGGEQPLTGRMNQPRGENGVMRAGVGAAVAFVRESGRAVHIQSGSHCRCLIIWLCPYARDPGSF